MTGTAYDLVHLRDLLAPQIGEEATQALMNHIPAVPVSELVTKADLQAFGIRVDARFVELDSEISQVESHLDSKISRLESHLDGKIDRLDVKIDQVESRLDAKIGRLEGRLIKWVVGLALTTVPMSAGVSAAVASAVAG